jgi:hypothetical protein
MLQLVVVVTRYNPFHNKNKIIILRTSSSYVMGICHVFVSTRELDLLHLKFLLMIISLQSCLPVNAECSESLFTVKVIG